MVSLDKPGNRSNVLLMAPNLAAVQTPEGRSIHLIDVENLLGGAGFAELNVIELMAEYGLTVTRGPEDHLVVASCHRAASATWLGCPEARRLVRSGRDGADRALLEVIERENVALRYDRIVIGSGDGIFAEPAAMLQALGAKVIVVAPVSGLASKLQLALRDVPFIDLIGRPQAPANVLERA
jgi:hypothetical protein